jgi:hypothetical protein
VEKKSCRAEAGWSFIEANDRLLFHLALIAGIGKRSLDLLPHALRVRVQFIVWERRLDIVISNTDLWLAERNKEHPCVLKRHYVRDNSV